MTTVNHQRTLSPNRFALIAGTACFFWAFLAWLSVIPNQDMLADAVQVQSLFTDPRIVLSFPGQKHAGTIEYPFQLIAESIASGNFYVHTFPRVFFAFLTGFFTAKLFLELFPTAHKWAFLTAIAVGPAIIHGLSGPEGNPVGVWWLVGNYSTSWLLIVIGAYLFARSTIKQSWKLQLLSGFIIGLGFFAHPNVIILIIPLGVLTILVMRSRIKSSLLLMSGVFVGIIPSLISYFFYSGNNTWDPSRAPFFVRDFYLNALGLNGIPDYISVVFPYALGFPASQTLISGQLQSTVTLVFALVITFTTVIGWLYSLKTNEWPAPIILVATAWFAAILGILFFVTFVDTVWFYATSLAILFWITVGVLPSAIKPKPLAIGLTIIILALTATSMFSHNWNYISQIPAGIENKSSYQSEIKQTANGLLDSGVEVIYGSYLDVIPIAYGSSFQLRPLSVRYNRFPLTAQESLQKYIVAVNSSPTDSWGEEGLAIASTKCLKRGDFSGAKTDYDIFQCPGSVISEFQ
jgi:hypothetical protein